MFNNRDSSVKLREIKAPIHKSYHPKIVAMDFSVGRRDHNILVYGI